MLKKFMCGAVMTVLVSAGVNSLGWANSGVVQFAELHDFISGQELPGGGILTREKHAVHIQLALADLDRDAAYSAWWVIFNRPSHCVSGAGACGEIDLDNPKVKASIFYATGFLTGADGTANVMATLNPGPVLGGVEVLLGPGLQHENAITAEIHFILRTHGPILEGEVAHQISSYDHECSICAEQSALTFPPAK